MLLEEWLKFEQQESQGGFDSQGAKHVKAKLPKRVKKRRKIETENKDGTTSQGWEEYYDYLFPDDQAQSKNLKILELAHKWKKSEENE